MAEGKQLDLVLRDMLFVTWAVEPERARKLVPERLELDTRTDEAGRAMAFVSAVCFRVADVRSSMLLLPALNFEQLNYRAYVKDGDRPAVCFLDMKVNSRMVTSLTSFLSVPIQYEDIDIKVSKPEFLGDAPEAQSYSVKSAGFQVDASIEGWMHYLYGDPSAGNASIKKDNPEMTDELIAQAIEKMRRFGIAFSGDAQKTGLGAMNDARWQEFFTIMAARGVYPRDLPYRDTYTLQFVNKGVGLERFVRVKSARP